MKFCTVKDLASELGVAESWIYDRTRTNGPETIPHAKFGKYVRFNPESPEFRRWLEAHEKGGIVGSDTQRAL
ncbi:MAG: helix-turn-helix domain-containing protein [Acidobacteria bacterium]|nr:helix-turn-helix domain-containing protein [Acidobacteriota bacterium]